MVILKFRVPIVLKSGNLNFQEPSGPVQVCNGIALPLPFTTLKFWLSCMVILKENRPCSEKELLLAIDYKIE